MPATRYDRHTAPRRDDPATCPIYSIARRGPLPGSPPYATSDRARARDATTAILPRTGGGLCLATAGTAAPIVGIVAGDGDILPPRYSGDSRVYADDCAQDFGDYITLRWISLADVKIPLRTRLTGATRTWLEGMPVDPTMDDLMEHFRQRLGAGDTCHPEAMVEF